MYICVYRTSGLYKNGSVTVFALNISPTDTVHLVFDKTVLHDQPIDVYMLSPHPYDGLLSKYAVTDILLNMFTSPADIRITRMTILKFLPACG